MKTIITITLLLIFAVGRCYSQDINWKSLNEDKRNIIQVNFGYNFGLVTQISYNRSFELIRPVLLGLDLSIPMGSDVLDDFKVRYGAQIQILEYNDFSFTIKILSNFRRYQTELVRIVSFGSDFAAVLGYFQPTWHVAGEFGFDKSIISNLKHSDILKSYFPGIKDGWYIPSGGHYYYGLQASKTLGDRFDVAMRIGLTRVQFNDEEAVVPAYASLGLGMRF